MADSQPSQPTQQEQPPPSSSARKNPDVDDAELEQDPDVGMVGTQDTVENTESQQPSSAAAVAAAAPVAPEQPDISMEMPPAPPSRKDATLREFLSKMDDYAPIIPDAVTAHYLTLSGLPPPPLPGQPTTPNTTPPQLSRLLALATQKFIADIAADAYQYSRIRAGTTASSAASAMNPLGMPVQPGQAGTAGAGAAGGEGGKAGGKGGAGGKEAHLGQARPGYGGGGQGGSGQGRTVLTMEDLGMAVGEYGANVKRSEFYR